MWVTAGKPVVRSVALLCQVPLETLASNSKGHHTPSFPAWLKNKNRLRCFIQAMYDEGIVNDQFFQLQAMKEVIRPDYVVRTITSYCVSCIRLFSTLTDQIYQQEVDFQNVEVLTLELYAKTSGVGAETVKCACAELLYASEMKDKNHCNRALYQIKNEFSYLRRKLETLVQMERRIIDLETMQ